MVSKQEQWSLGVNNDVEAWTVVSQDDYVQERTKKDNDGVQMKESLFLGKCYDL